MFIHNQVFSSPEEPGYEVLLICMSVLVNTVWSLQVFVSQILQV